MKSVQVTRVLTIALLALTLVLASRQAHAYEPTPSGYPGSEPLPGEYPGSPDRAGADRPAAPKDWEDKDHVRVGALLGLGFPRPLSIQGLVKIERVVALGLEYGMMPNLKLGYVESSFWGVAADARVFPFRGAFFIGLRGGYQRMNATATVALGELGTFSESATAETWFLNPRMGFLWTFKPGLTVGLDAGVQLPVKTTFVNTLPTGVPTDINSTITGVANAFGHDIVPTVDLLRIGFLF